MTYSERLVSAMSTAKVDRKALAGALGITVQAVGQVINGQTKALDAANHVKASLHLRCDPLWLATGKSQRDFTPPPAPQTHWPFPDLDFARFDKLSSNQKIEIQGVVRDRIDRFENDLKASTAEQKKRTRSTARRA